MSSASSRPKPKSTTCAPRLRGAAKTPISSWRWRWRRRCSRCGKREAGSGKGWPGSTPSSPDEVAQDAEVAAAVRARALADRAVLDLVCGAADSVDQAQQALALARKVDDPAVLARALTACGLTAAYNAEAGRGVLRRGDRASPGSWTISWRLSQILAFAGQCGDRGR